MIKKLRLKFIIASMSGILLVLIIIFGTQNYMMYKSSREQTQRLLENIVHTDGKITPSRRFEDRPVNKNTPSQPLPGMMRATKFFFMKLDNSNEILDYDISGISDLSESDAKALALDVLASGKEKGNKDGYQYLTGQKSYGYIVVFAERGIESSMLTQLISISAIAVMGGIIVFFALTILFSKWAVKPIQTAFNNQRSFISNASHELKTPITVVSANAEVLKNEIGDNKWLSNIQSQTDRMRILVNDLFILAKTDEQNESIPFQQFNLSASFLHSVLEFESIAYENHIKLVTDIDPDILFQGNEQMLKQVIVILLDNAVKHTNYNGEIKISVKQLNSKIRIQVYNTGEGIDESEKDKIFERFYRSDSSRSRDTGGYGLGLSIAKSIIDVHHGKISVASEKGKWICFEITL